VRASTHPTRLDVTDGVAPGENSLETRVANQWPNRIIGDLALPPDKRLTRTNIAKFDKATPLLPSGLLGPVRLVPMRSGGTP
jgi:hypothetical protein